MEQAPRPLYRRVVRRRPLTAADLPAIARLYRAAHRPRRRVAKRLVGKPGYDALSQRYEGA